MDRTITVVSYPSPVKNPPHSKAMSNQFKENEIVSRQLYVLEFQLFLQTKCKYERIQLAPITNLLKR